MPSLNEVEVTLSIENGDEGDRNSAGIDPVRARGLFICFLMASFVAYVRRNCSLLHAYRSDRIYFIVIAWTKTFFLAVASELLSCDSTGCAYSL